MGCTHRDCQPWARQPWLEWLWLPAVDLAAGGSERGGCQLERRQPWIEETWLAAGGESAGYRAGSHGAHLINASTRGTIST